MPFEELSCVRHFLEFIEIWMRLHLFKAVEVGVIFECVWSWSSFVQEYFFKVIYCTTENAALNCCDRVTSS